MNALHERSAARLLDLCEKNRLVPTPIFSLEEILNLGFRGLYVKMGQAIGTQAAVLPAPYRALSKLLDGAERVPYDVVEQVRFP